MRFIAKLLVAMMFFSLLTQQLSAQVGREQSYESGGFELTSVGNNVSIYVDADDHKAVIRAVGDLQLDVERITDVRPPIINDLNQGQEQVIIVGTIGHSAVVDQLIANGKLDQADLDQVQGKWEASLRTVVTNPLPGIDEALVIIGSDRRGTIYGIYDVSEVIGVSPWYWWADVTPIHQDTVIIEDATYIRQEPDVKYRGIFINDEWNLKEWSKSLDPDDNIGPETYKKIYELMLRLKANLIQPAMHPYSDNFTVGQPDVLNHVNADAYGIVVGAAQPLFRQNRTEWYPFADRYYSEHGYKPGFDYSIPANRPAILQYWEERIMEIADYELAWSLGMRGLGDSSMQASRCNTVEEKAELLSRIIEDQRQLLRKHVLKDENGDLSSVFQVFPVYKEVLELYNAGVKENLSDDISIKWSEDNHGHIRQLPDEQEQLRSGGNTLYYHLSYWGAPKSYLWLYTTPFSLVCEELDKAYENNTKKAWIFNIGDIKPAEMALDFVINKAWDIEGLNKTKTEAFMSQWAKNIFGSTYANEIAEIMVTYQQLGIARRPEFLTTNLFNQIDFGDEWTKRMAMYEDLFNRVNAIYESDVIPETYKDALYELVVYPIRGAYYANKKFYYADKYNLYKEQGRGESVNIVAALANQAQADEEAETAYYNNELSQGKWNKIMNPYPNKIPSAPRVPSVTPINVSDEAGLGVIAEGQTSMSDTTSLKFSTYTRDYRFIDLFNTGSGMLSWTGTASHEWIKLVRESGTIRDDERLWVSIDWESVPQGDISGSITISDGSTSKTINVEVSNQPELPRESVVGYVEANGYVSIQAEHYDNKIDRGARRWEVFDDLGRDSDAVLSYPSTGDAITSNIKDTAPELQYKINFSSTGTFQTTIYRIPTLNKDGVRFAIALDDAEPQIIEGNNVIEGHGGNNDTWSKNVVEGIEKLTTNLNVSSAGEHTLKVWMVDRSVALDKIVINTGNVNGSYYAPPESYHSQFNRNPGQLPQDVLKTGILETLVKEAEGLLSQAQTGNGLGQYGQSDYDNLAVAVISGQNVLSDIEATLTEYQEAQSVIMEALRAMRASRIMTDAEFQYYVYDTMENRELGSTPSDLEIKSSGNGSAVIDEEASNKILDMNSNTGQIEVVWAFEDIQGKVIMEVDAKINSDKWIKLPYIVPAVTGAFTDGNKLKLRDGDQWREAKNINKDQWYAIKVVMDTNTQTYDFYLDNELVAEGYGFRSPTTSINKIILGSSEAGATVAVDNVKLYTPITIENQYTYYVYDTMENRELGSTPSDIEVEVTGNGSAVVEDETSNKILTMNSNSGQIGAEWSFAELQGEIFMEVDVRISSDAWMNLPYITPAVTCAFTDGNIIKLRDGDQWRDVKNISKEQWYTIKIAMNTDTQTYDYYIDDELVAEGYSFRNPTPSIYRIYIGSTVTNASFAIDNVKLYTNSAN